MKKIVQIMKYNKSSFAEHGFQTAHQQSAACCAAELLDEISKCTDDFGMFIMFVSKADMLGDRPVTVWTGLPIGKQREMFEDYMLKRLKMKEAKENK